MDKLESPYPILNRLEGQGVSTDELDYWARRLDSCCASENEKTQAMPSRRYLSDIKGRED